MKILILLFLALSGCVSTHMENKKIGDLFLEDTSINQNSKQVGEIYLKNEKLIFVKSQIDEFSENEMVKKKIKSIKFELDEINNRGGVVLQTPGKAEFDKKGNLISEGQYSSLRLIIF